MLKLVVCFPSQNLPACVIHLEDDSNFLSLNLHIAIVNGRPPANWTRYRYKSIGGDVWTSGPWCGQRIKITAGPSQIDVCLTTVADPSGDNSHPSDFEISVSFDETSQAGDTYWVDVYTRLFFCTKTVVHRYFLDKSGMRRFGQTMSSFRGLSNAASACPNIYPSSFTSKENGTSQDSSPSISFIAGILFSVHNADGSSNSNLNFTDTYPMVYASACSDVFKSPMCQDDCPNFCPRPNVPRSYDGRLS